MNLLKIYKILIFSIASLGLSPVYARSYGPIELKKEDIQIIKKAESNKSWGDCVLINKSSAVKFVCLNYLAYSLNSTAPCDQLDQEYLIGQCYGLVSIATQDKSLCKGFKNAAKKKCKNPRLDLILKSMNPKTRKQVEAANKRHNKKPPKMEETKLLDSQ